MKPLFIELFSGSKTTTREFEKLGFDTFTIDIDFEPDLVKDMMCVDCGDFAHLDIASRPLVVVWASPPCKAFSLANTHNHHFAPGGKPLTEKAHEAIDMVAKTLELIKLLDPDFLVLGEPIHRISKASEIHAKIPHGQDSILPVRFGVPEANFDLGGVSLRLGSQGYLQL